MKVLVTGSEGAVGRYLCEQLLPKYDVIGVDISEPPRPRQWEHVTASITNRETVRELMKGCSCVINTAAIVDIGAEYPRLVGVNRDAVKHLVSACAGQNSRLIHISSGSIYGMPGRCAYLTEDSYSDPTNPYEQTKVESEKIVRDSHINWTIIRPGMIYGPRAKALGAAIATIPPIMKRFMGKKVPWFLGGPQTNWVHAEDVARACIHCMQSHHTIREVFNVAEDQPAPFGGVITSAIRGYGLERRFWAALPPRDALVLLRPLLQKEVLFDTINLGANLAYALAGGKDKVLRPNIDQEAGIYATKDVIFANTKLKADGFYYIHQVQSSFAEATDWYKLKGWIP